MDVIRCRLYQVRGGGTGHQGTLEAEEEGAHGDQGIHKFRNLLQNLPEPCPGDPSETGPEATARHRSLCGPGALACLRAIPSDPEREINPVEFVATARRVLGIESWLGERCNGRGCPTRHVNTRHVRHYQRIGGQTRQHHAVKRALVKCLQKLGLPGTMEDSSPMREGIMDIVLPPGSLHNAPNHEFRRKGILLDVVLPDPQTRRYLRGGQPRSSANLDGVAASTAEADKRNRYERPERPSFDHRTYRLVPFALECYGRIGKEGMDFLDQVASHVVAKTAAIGHVKKGNILERIRQTISTSLQVAISQRVSQAVGSHTPPNEEGHRWVSPNGPDFSWVSVVDDV